MNVIEAVGMTPTAPECRQRICSARKDFLRFRLDMEDVSMVRQGADHAQTEGAL
jgi:hypothetical protein